MERYIGDTMRRVQLFLFTTTKHAKAILTPNTKGLDIHNIPRLRSDIIAGFTVATIIIPNAMAYAILVGLPPQMGLYATLIGTIAGLLWGSSSFVITGSVGIVSLLTLTTLIPLATIGTASFIALATILAVMVGFFQFFAGFFRLGYLARLIPYSVLMGFSSAAAIIIASTQVPALLGFSIVQKEHMIDSFLEIIANMDSISFLTAIIGISTLTFLTTMRRIAPTFPTALITLAGGIIASYIFNFASLGIKTIGEIPAHLPILHVPNFSVAIAASLMGSAAIIALIGFMETFAIAKTIARTTKEKLSADRELVGQGIANIGAGMLGGFPVSGSFSSSAVNVASGAKTILSGITVSFMILIAILFLTPILSHLPKVILAAIIISAVLRMVDLRKIRESFFFSKHDGILAVTTFVLSFIFKPDVAVVVGVILALLLLIRSIMFAGVSELGIDGTLGVMRRAGTKDSIQTIPGVLIIRVDMSILYTNAEKIINDINLLFIKRMSTDKTICMLVLDFAGVNLLDLTAIEDLGEYFSGLRAEGVDICVIYAKRKQLDLMMSASHHLGNITFLRTIAELNQRYKTLCTQKK